jgi:hypothetical protein
MKTFKEEIIAKEIDAAVARFKEALREADNAEARARYTYTRI